MNVGGENIAIIADEFIIWSQGQYSFSKIRAVDDYLTVPVQENLNVSESVYNLTISEN